jgi:hypothetical protein
MPTPVSREQTAGHRVARAFHDSWRDFAVLANLAADIYVGLSE